MVRFNGKGRSMTMAILRNWDRTISVGPIFMRTLKNRETRDKQKKLLPWYSAGIAASLIMMIVSLIFFVNDNSDDIRQTKANEPSLTWKNFVNTTNLTQVIVLPDSSKVAIEPESKLKFSSVFNKTKREVYLEGEAFFQVTHNANIPFFVHANEVTTKVLGTSFIIKAIKHEREITVVVKTGKVSVFTSPEKEEKISGCERNHPDP